MPYKSGKFWSSVSLGLVAIFAAALDARATVTLKPTRLNGTILSNVQTNTAYYPASVTPSSTLFLDSGDTSVPPTILDLSKTQSELSTSRSNMVVLMLQSDKALSAPAAPQYLVITLYAGGAAGIKPVPIAFAQSSNFSDTGGVPCYLGLPCQGTDTGAIPTPATTQPFDPVGNNVYLLAVRYTPSTQTQIGIYPRDICYYYKFKYGNSAYGCDASTNQPTTGVSTAAMQLTANIEIATSETSVGDATKVQDSTLAALTLTFEATGPTMTSANCPSTSGFYFPGDGQIFVDATQVSATLSGAPASTLIVAGNDGSAPVLTSSYATANSVYGRVTYNATVQMISGFTNTTTGSDHQYQIGFMVRDYSGLVGVSSSGCTVSGVQTSSIQGFLKKSSCFIATAAYRDPDAAPVMMLRQFRDRILLQQEWGKAFVSWYYGWSPSAAEWLMENPVFRYPVLILLAPVEILAWCALHPGDASLAALALAGIASLIRLIRINRRDQRRRSA